MPRAGRSASGHERLMKAEKQPQGIAEHEGAGLEAALGPGSDLPVLKRAEAAQVLPHRPPLMIELHRSNERRLARRPSSAFASVAFPAPVRTIELHPAAQRAGAVALLHHLHQLVLDRTRGVVAHSQLPRQLQRRDTVLRLGDQVHRQEPRAQRQLRAVQDRARGQRDLMPAAATLIQGTALKAPVPGMVASRACRRTANVTRGCSRACACTSDARRGSHRYSPIRAARCAPGAPGER